MKETAPSLILRPAVLLLPGSEPARFTHQRHVMRIVCVCMFSGLLTGAEAVCGRLRDGTRQRSMAGLGGTFVKFLFLIGELYFLWRHQQDEGEKYRVCQLLLPCGPKGLINLAKIIVHIIVILPSRFSRKLETLCSACCYHWSSFLLQTCLCI